MTSMFKIHICIKKYVKVVQSSFLQKPDTYAENFSKYRDKFEIKLYNKEMTNAVTPPSWFNIL